MIRYSHVELLNFKNSSFKKINTIEKYLCHAILKLNNNNLFILYNFITYL